MTRTKPPVTGTAHTLPFDRLSPRDFERLCLWLVRREGYERAEHLGAAGSEQGRDVVAWREGKLWAFQCKSVQRFGPKDVLAEIDKIVGLPDDLRPAALVFLVTCDVSAKTRQKARERCGEGMECHFWAGTELDAMVKRHPEIVKEFFREVGSDERPTSEVKITGDGNVAGDGSSAQVVKAESGSTVGNVFQIVVTQLFGRRIDEQRAQRNRRAMLRMVRDCWVKGVLEQSLHGAAMIELGLKERADAVERPWDMVLQTEREDRTLPPGTRIIDVFDEMGRNLLILGQPGSGKTTMLLELARDTIARAERDLTQPIPVVFNLSSWADKRQPIAEWLVEELNTKYSIPKRVARPWVEHDELLLLLDGLDEVKREYREDSVRAINGFRKEHLVPLVVCSRFADYQALTTRLRLQGAVLLQPLTPQQVDEYLRGAGMALSAVRETLQHDPTLQELAETPLMLSVITLAYRGRSVEDLQTLETPVARRKHVFESYVQRMFERRRVDHPYSPQQTIQWLAWLAQKMSAHGQTVFLIERLQPDWLPARSRRQMRIVARLAVRLVFGLVVGLVGGLVFGLVGGLSGKLVGGLVFGLLGGLVPGLDGRLDSVEPVELLKWSWGGVVRGLVFGLVFGLAVGLVAGLVGERGGVLVSGLFSGLGGGLVAGLVVGLFSGLVVGVVLGLSNMELEARIVPNQGIWRSARNALIVCLVSGLVAELFCVLVSGLFSGFDLVFGLVFGLLVAIGLGLHFGGLAVILHIVLRYFLWRDGYLAWNLVRFLDYAAERIFLRKVGGGYVFIHRLLQDYFASLYQGQ